MTDYFQKAYASMGGQLSVVFIAGRIEVAWEPTAPETTAMASIGPLLQQRRFEEARPLLETLLQLEPEHPEALYNLGVLASEEGKPEEARLLLRRAVVANADDAHAQANAQVALARRLGLNDEPVAQALSALRKLRNAFAHSAASASLADPAHSSRLAEIYADARSNPLWTPLATVLERQPASDESPIDPALRDFILLITVLVALLEASAQQLRPLEALVVMGFSGLSQ